MSDEDVVGFSPADTTHVDPSYRLGPGDEIDMVFLFDSSLNARIIVRPDGGINLPILGDITVAGETPGRLARRIAEAYSRYYTNPQLSINLTRYAPSQCYVLGAVRYPKAVQIRPGMTILGALADAGGPTDLANMKSTVLIRRVSHNQAVARRVNLARFTGGRGLSSDLYLHDFDIVYVPTTFVGKITLIVDQIFGKLVSVPVFYLRGWEAFNTDLVYNRPIRPSEVQQEAGIPAGSP
jgi:polysaccharide export outer membrane protein